MEDVVGFLFVWLFMEFIFWGLAYTTGCLLTPIISLGKWYPDSVIKFETGRVVKKQSGFKLIERSDRIYLGAWGVTFIGFFFWILVILLIILI